MLSESANIALIQNEIKNVIAKSNKDVFVVIDGDRTLIPVDSTKHFFKYLDLKFYKIKSTFQKHGYSFKAFYNVAMFYSLIEKEKYIDACSFTAKSVNIYPDFLSFIESIKSLSDIIVVTSGIKLNWQNILKNHSLDFVGLIGGNYLPDDKFIVDKNAKGIIVDELIKADKKVFTFGDGLIDFDMLKRAHYSYLVVNEKMNKDIKVYTNEIPQLKQISFTESFHPDISLTNLKNVSVIIQKYYSNGKV